MPLSMLKVLPTNARAIWEHAYKSEKARGLSDSEAAKRAWGAVENAGYHKNPAGRWVRTKKKEAAEKKSLLLVLGENDTPFSPVGERLFRKMLIPVGKWTHPQAEGEEFVVTRERIEGWIERFETGFPDKIPVPIGHKGYDNALQNTGYVQALEFDPTPVDGWQGGALYGIIEFTNPEAAKLAEQNSIPDVSIGLNLSYEDSATGEEIGEVLEHVALTQRAHVKNMTGWEKLAAEQGFQLTTFVLSPGDKETKMTVTLEQVQAAEKKAELEKKRADEAAAQVALEKKRADDAEAKLESDKKEKIEAERKERVAKNKEFVDSLIGGKTEGAKYGLPPSCRPVLMELLDNSDGKKVTLESGEKPLSDAVREMLIDFSKAGLVPMEEIAKEGDNKPGDGKGSEAAARLKAEALEKRKAADEKSVVKL